MPQPDQFPRKETEKTGETNGAPARNDVPKIFGVPLSKEKEARGVLDINTCEYHTHMVFPLFKPGVALFLGLSILKFWLQ